MKIFPMYPIAIKNTFRKRSALVRNVFFAYNEWTLSTASSARLTDFSVLSMDA